LEFGIYLLFGACNLLFPVCPDLGKLNKRWIKLIGYVPKPAVVIGDYGVDDGVI